MAEKVGRLFVTNFKKPLDTPICHDCGVEEGQIHKYGCDMERCPYCGKQLISYSHSRKLSVSALTRKGRIPYITYPNLCAKCGQLWPEMFTVPDEEWTRYIQPDMRDQMICWDCYCYIRSVIDAGTINE